MNVSFKSTFAALSLLCCASSPGALIVYEGFDLAPGGLTDQSAGPSNDRRGASSFGWTASWNNNPYRFTQAGVTSGSLQRSTAVQPFYSFQPVGNRGSSFDEDESPAFRKINSAGFGKTITGSCLVDLSLTVSVDYIGLVLEPLTRSGFDLVARSGSLLVGTQAAGNREYDTGIMSSPGTHLIVFQLTLDASGTEDNFQLWFDRDPTSTAPNFQVLAQFGDGLPSEFHFSAQTDSLIEIDEIRLGTTVVDVIPEPSSVSLMFAGAAMFIACCRRKRNG